MRKIANRIHAVQFRMAPLATAPSKLLYLTANRVVLVLALLFFMGMQSDAQVSNASLRGVVLDFTGAVVPGATVSATQTETGFRLDTASDDNGSFSFPTIPVGPYKLDVTKTGFASYEQTGIVLSVGEAHTVQITLTVGQISETVLVNSDVPAVDSTTPTIQQLVGQTAISDLPLNGRNPADLVNIVPGVTNALLTPPNPNSTVKGTNTLPSQIAPTVNGVRPGGTYFSLDGATNVDPFNVIGGPFPNPDATQEFAVVTGSYGARYVSAPGGAVNIITRSGTNQFHGSVFEFIRNGYFNARNYFAVAPDILKRNQFGFAAGGPILRNKLFVFGSLQETPVHTSSTINTFVGTAAMRSGIFTSPSGATVTIPVNPVAANVLKAVPSATNAAGFYQASIPIRSSEPQWTVKVDYDLGQHRLFARYFADHLTIPGNAYVPGNIFAGTGSSNLKWDTVAAGDTWSTKGGAWVIDGRFSYITARADGSTVPGTSGLNAHALGISNLTIDSSATLPTFYAAGFLVSGLSNSYSNRQSWDGIIDVLHTSHKHEISFGTDLRFVGSQLASSGHDPSFLFQGIASNIFFGPLSNNGFADFILGTPLIFLQQDGSYVNVNGKLLGFYGSDKYSVSDRITLTAGLRWDPFQPFTIPHNHIDCFRPGKQSTVYTNAPLGLLYPGDRGCSDGGTPGKYGFVQPRIGIAYKLDRSGATALRAGWGIYSTQPQLQSFLGFSAPPFVRSFFLVNPFMSVNNPWGSNGLSDPFTGGFHDANYQPPSNVSFASAIAAGINASAIDIDFRPAYVQQRTLSLQHAFNEADSMELAYVGNTGIHIAQTYDDNLPVYTATASQSNENVRRPYGAEGLTQIKTIRSNSTSSYNGFNATFQHRGKGGVNLYGGFNWSKCIDEGSQPAGTQNTTGNIDPRQRRGRCDYDQNLTFRSTVIWTSPSLKSSGNLVRIATGGWTISSLITVDNGQPYSVTDSSDTSYTGNGLDLADRVSSQPVFVNGKLNYAGFKHPAPGTFGSSGRNNFRGPRYVNVDPSVMKTFPTYSDRISILFRAEAFNVFNHPVLYAPSSDYNNQANFGVVTNAHDPRILQFAAKILF